MKTKEKPIVWLYGEIKTPPFSQAARIETGYLLRKLQMGHNLTMPSSRPMASIEKGCHELRVNDEDITWRIIYHIDIDAIIILDVFSKKTSKTPKAVIDICKQRIKDYESIK
jgi:phage-related protein